VRRWGIVATLTLLGGLGPAGCRGEPTDRDAGGDAGPGRWCRDVDCSGHGTCREDDARGWCECDPGYVADRWECIEPPPEDADVDLDADPDEGRDSDEDRYPDEV
jgi:hypothetical protein